MNFVRLLSSLLLVAHTSALTVVDCGAASISKRLPFENQDAYFCTPPRFYGIFDGVSQCPQSRAYARTLAQYTSTWLSREATDGGSFRDQAEQALEYASEKAQRTDGASTALLLRIDLEQEKPQASVYTLGDCTCMLLRTNREGTRAVTVIDSCVEACKFHDNGAPFQLAGGNFISDQVSDGEDQVFGVAEGDVLCLFTDGITNNLKPQELASLVGPLSSQSCTSMAETIANEARQREIRLDDASVVALRIGSDGDGTPLAATTSAVDKGALEAAGEKLGELGKLFGL